MTSYSKPLPNPGKLDAGFWQNTREKRLSLQVCNACGHAHFPGAPVCPKCLSADQEWKPVSGRGTLEAWAEMHRAYWDGFKNDVPYNVCVVRLAEGPLMVSNLVGDRSQASVGLPVRAVFEAVTTDITLPKFEIVPA